MDAGQHYLQVAEESVLHYWRRILSGLRSPEDTGSHKYATSELRRVFARPAIAASVTASVLFALIFFVHITHEDEPPSLVVDPYPDLPQDLDIEPEPPEEDIAPPEITELLTKDVSLAGDINPEAELAEAASQTEPVMEHAIAMLDTKSVMQLKIPSGLRNPPGIQDAVAKHGAGPSLQSVIKALRWLKEHQNEDGSWSGSGSRTGMTGLALLCYLAHGETPTSEEFGQTVEKAIRHLMYVQTSGGRFKQCGEHYVYGHAIAAYGLAESYNMTRMVFLKDPMEKAIQIIIDGQQEGGAWDYDYSKGKRRDLSVTAWQVQALKAAKLAGASNKDLDQTIERAVQGVKTFAAGEGYLSYGGNGELSPTLTAAGVLCLQLLGKADDRYVRDGLNAIRDLMCSWTGGAEHNNTYSWYYATQAFFQNGGGPWAKWNKHMLPMMVQNQLPDGHWSHGGTHSSSPVYDTTMCCLTLEIYYKYLPSYSKVDVAMADTQTVIDPGDIKIAIDTVL
jgi:hypothetical protein